MLESLYRLINSLLEPYTFCYVVLLVGVVNLWRRRVESSRRLWLVTAPFLLLTILRIPVVSYLAQGALEWQNPPRAQLPENTQAIVVLSGGMRRPDTVWPKAHLASDSMLRCLFAAELHQQQPDCPIFLTGDRVWSDEPGPSLAQLMSEFLIRLGVPQEVLRLEEQSRSTYQNARFTAEMLKTAGIDEVVLITDALHLPRARLCFKKQGIKTIPAGSYYRATEFDWSLTSFLPTSGGGVHKVMHEWLGMLYYWMLDRI